MSRNLSYLPPSSQQTQNVFIIFIQCWTNVEDVGPTLYKCYKNVFCLLGQWNRFFFLIINHSKQETFTECWPTICDAGSTLKRHQINVSPLLGDFFHCAHILVQVTIDRRLGLVEMAISPIRSLRYIVSCTRIRAEI